MSDQWATYALLLGMAVVGTRLSLGMLYVYCMLRCWIMRRLNIVREPDIFSAYVEWYGRHFV